MDIFKLGDKILALLEAVFGFWNNQISLVFAMLGQSPVSFKGGGPWAVIEGIEPVFVAVGSSLVVLFFVIGFCSESIDVKDEMRFESVFRMLIRLGLAEWFVANNVTIMKAFFTSIGNLVGLISAGTTTQLAIDSTQADIIKGLELGAEIVPLNGNERLKVLYDYYHLGDEGSFDFDIKKAKKVGADFRNDLCNGMVKYFPDHFEDESKFCKALFIKKYPSSLSDRFINEITSLPVHSITSIDVVPVPKDLTTKVLQKKYLGIESDIIKQQRVRNKNNDFSTEISYAKRTEKKEIEEIMDDVRENDQCLFFVGVTIILMAESKKELESVCETVETMDIHMLPITGVHHKSPMNFSQEICNYTEKGRKKIHNNQRAVESSKLKVYLLISLCMERMKKTQNCYLRQWMFFQIWMNCR